MGVLKAAPLEIAEIYSLIPSLENQFSLKSSHSYSCGREIKFVMVSDRFVIMRLPYYELGFTKINSLGFISSFAKSCGVFSSGIFSSCKAAKA